MRTHRASRSAGPKPESHFRFLCYRIPSFRGSTGDMILYLDEDLEPMIRLGFSDFQAVLANQVATGAMTKLKA